MKSILNYIKYVKKNKLFIAIIGLIILAGFIHFIQKKEPFNEDADNLKIAIHTVFILKENLPFLEEWIQHHKKIGINKLAVVAGYKAESINVSGIDIKINKAS